MSWSAWIPVARFLDSGWNHDPEVPCALGVYRFRVNEDHKGPHAGKVVYVGMSNAQSTTICQRVGNFISAAMGFYTQHSGGNTFYNRTGTSQEHGLNVRDLEVSWSVDDCPPCAETEEYRRYSPPPMFNQGVPKPCGQPTCQRSRNLLAKG